MKTPAYNGGRILQPYESATFADCTPGDEPLDISGRWIVVFEKAPELLAHKISWRGQLKANSYAVEDYDL